MHNFDKIDINILKTLQNNARITNLELAKAVYLSPSACLVRVQKLRDSGVIDRDMSVIDITKIGPALQSFLEITLQSHSLKDHKTFEKAILEIEDITMAVKVSGRFDYLLSVTTRDMPALNALSDHLLGQEFGISKLVTIPVIDIAKPFSGFPLAQLLS